MKKQWFHILLALVQAPSHGAELQRRVSERSSGRVKLYPVTLYRSLDQLSERGYISELPDPDTRTHNEKRRYYEITTEGRSALAAAADEMKAAAHLAHAALKGR